VITFELVREYGLLYNATVDSYFLGRSSMYPAVEHPHGKCAGHVDQSQDLVNNPEALITVSLFYSQHKVVLQLVGDLMRAGLMQGSGLSMYPQAFSNGRICS
jgi:hypothetical protein